MTGQSPAGEALWLTVKNIMQKEGPGSLMKGCFPRMLWIAPLGAMNFAGYELAKQAMVAASAEDAANTPSAPAPPAAPAPPENLNQVPSATVAAVKAEVVTAQAEVVAAQAEVVAVKAEVVEDEAIKTTTTAGHVEPVEPAPTSNGFIKLPERTNSSASPPPIEVK